MFIELLQAPYSPFKCTYIDSYNNYVNHCWIQENQLTDIKQYIVWVDNR